MSKLAAEHMADSTNLVMPAKRRWIRPVLAAAGYAGIAFLAWRAIDRERFFRGIEALTAAHVLVILIVAVLHIAGRALRFHRLLLRAHPHEYAWTDGVRIFLVGLSASAVTPARAGDFIKAHLVKRYGVGLSTGLGLVMVERMLDLLVIASAIVVIGACLSGGSASVPWRGASVVLLLGLLGGIVILTVKTARTPLLQATARLLAKSVGTADRRARFEQMLGDTFRVWDAIFVTPRTFAAYWSYSAVVWAVEFMKLWLALRFVGVVVSAWIVLFVYPVSIVAGILTVLPFSEGVVGVTSVALLGSMAAVDSGAATIAVVLDRVASTIPPLLLWGFFALITARRSAARRP